ncbi:MAG: hypothetical protein IJ421_05900 [Prevotella sp.]|nr:hypothetical protein [Prevotella sp.]
MHHNYAIIQPLLCHHAAIATPSYSHCYAIVLSSLCRHAIITISLRYDDNVIALPWQFYRSMMA